MRDGLSYIWICLLSLIALTACDVHEFPEDAGDKVPFTLHLDFSTEMPLYKEIVYTRGGEDDPATKVAAEQHDIRYIIKVFRTTDVRNSTRVAEESFVFSKDDIRDLNHTVTIDLYEGTYTFLVWADYVDAGSLEDKYYDTGDFAEIILSSKNPHNGNTDYRDAFRGEVTATVTDPVYYVNSAAAAIDNQATVPMIRPMGKYQFVSTDVDIFLTRVAEQMREQGLLAGIDPSADPLLAYEQLLKQIDLGEYQVVFRYNAFMPCSFNMFTNKPADSWTGITYRGALTMLQSGKMSLGFDYIFVNGTETTLAISVAVFNKDGVEISSTNAINVPIVRSKLTLVTGDFLTSKSSGGVNIQYEYNGEYNVEIQ